MIDALRVVGPCRGHSGHDRHTRALVRQLQAAGIRLQVDDFEAFAPRQDTGRDFQWLDDLTAAVDANIVLHFLMPTQVAPRPDHQTVNFTMFEAQPLPVPWASASSHMDMTIVPNVWCHEVWATAGVPAERLAICPLGVDGHRMARPPPVVIQLQIAGRPLSDYRYRFLNIAALRARKNHLGLLRAWYSAVTALDHAVLVVKTMSPPDRFMRFMQSVATLQAELGLRPGTAAPVLFINELMSETTLHALYHACTHYISMSRGEGWDLPMMEAGAAGLHLVGPDHTGYGAYMRAEDCHVLPSQLSPVDEQALADSDDADWFRGALWSEPDHGAAVDAIQSIVRSAGQPAKPQQRLIEQFDWRISGQRLIEILSAL